MIIGLGTDLCQNQPTSVLTWMRGGRWSRETDFGEGSADDSDWPEQPAWFRSNLDFRNISEGLASQGFSSEEVDKIMGSNWFRFYNRSFTAHEF